MSHRKKTGITILLSIFVCLMGLLGSVAGSLRFAMRDSAIETMVEEWELSQMQITKIAAYMSMAQFLVVMMETPGISEEGTINLIDADYTKDFIAAKIRDYRDDLLRNNGKGTIFFSELVQLEEENRDAVCQDLQYSISAADLERYEMIWDNLALTERSALENYRSQKPILLAAAGVVLSVWFLIVAAVLCVPGAGAAFWYLYGHSFKGYGVYGMILVIVGVADCIVSLLRGSLVSLVNHIMDVRSNLMTLAFTPAANMLLIIGVTSLLLGMIAFALRANTKKRR